MFRQTAVKPVGDLRLALSYADGTEFVADLADWIHSTKFLKPLLEQSLFSTVRINEWHGVIEFGDGSIDLAADNLATLPEAVVCLWSCNRHGVAKASCVWTTGRRFDVQISREPEQLVGNSLVALDSELLFAQHASQSRPVSHS